MTICREDLAPKFQVGRWELIEFQPVTKPYGGRWLCKCLCSKGTIKSVPSVYLVSGESTSCGCFREENRTNLRKTHGEANRTPEYKVWCGMRARCQNPNEKAYRFYGAKGIMVCERWRNSYENFLEDMGRRPGPGYELDRKNPLLDYSRDNCQWLLKKLQNRNRRDNVNITFNGETKCICAWAEARGMGEATIRYRIKIGWSVADALTTPPGPNNRKRTRGVGHA